MMTFIADRETGNKIDVIEDKRSFNGTLNPAFIAKYCEATEDTENISEISDWNTTAEEVK